MSQGGAKFGKYTLVRKLSSGGVTDVFLAKQPGVAGFAREVVIKCIAQSHVHDLESVARFLDEAKLVARLSHPNIIAVHEFGQVDDRPYMMMEYVNGMTVARLLGITLGFEPAHALRIASELCAGLEYAHNLCDGDGVPIGFVHRDVSPENVLLGGDGSVKLTGFGMAKAALSTRETASVYGKDRYAHISPEQARDEKVDHRADVHGVGVLLWEALTGELLFRRDSVLDTIEAVATVTPRSVLRRYPDISPGIDDIISKATAKSADERFKSCAELQEAIDEYASDEGLLSSSLALRRYIASYESDSDGAPDGRDGPGSGQIVIESIEHPVTEDMTIPDTSLAESMNEVASGRASSTVSSTEPERDDAAIPRAPSSPEEDEEYDEYEDMETIPMQRAQPYPSQPPPELGERVAPASGRQRSRLTLWAGLFVAGVGLVAALTYFVLRTDMERMVRDGPIAASIVEDNQAKLERDDGRDEGRGDASTESSSESAADAFDGVDGAFLTIVSDPPGAQLFIDGNESGEWTAVGNFPIDVGEHHIELRLRGYERWQRRVNVERGERKVVRARLLPFDEDDRDAEAGE